MKLAIIIPYFKITYFNDTLQSLSNQTNKNFKVYIGDDASPEDPKQLLDKYKTILDYKYQRFRSNLGSISLVQQWERCIALSESEEWLMILGDDDYLDESVVASFYDNYNVFSQSSNLLRYSSKLLNTTTNTISSAYLHPIWEDAKTSYYRKVNSLTRSSLSEHIFKRDIYNEFGFKNFPLAWNSDDCAWLDFSNNKPIYSINDSIVFVRISDLNISGKTDNLELKQKSQLSFYKYIITKKHNLFSRDELLVILRRYEIGKTNIKKLSVSEWFFLFVYYLKFFKIKPLKKMFKRFFKSIINKA
ncbi:glycosyltransferase family 2 protein [Algibacter lectus]|uniref:Glycosyl transferase family 2 n=1 Tax=Algibacter lectus TaxID=221126 RepID=A0A4R8MJG3_9FLAO|nr:glycosyltransferase family 2 protein [Algibacter lectus]MWW24822.1 glycosyltransferase [Algibacter lectus]TDY64767.1 glycosyl transferase family 2 [Algibacter lectus]